MRFVADDKIKVEGMRSFLVQLLLRLNDTRQGLIRRKHHPHTRRLLLHQVQRVELQLDRINIGGRGHGEVFNREPAVVILTLLLRHFRIGTDAHRANPLRGKSRPFVKCLCKEGNRRHKEENKAVASDFLFRNLKRGVGLARAASHDEPSALRGFEMFVKRSDCLFLMIQRFTLVQNDTFPVRPFFKFCPINRRIDEVPKSDDEMLDRQVLERFNCVG